jgi:hypothetical protein
MTWADANVAVSNRVRIDRSIFDLAGLSRNGHNCRGAGEDLRGVDRGEDKPECKKIEMHSRWRECAKPNTNSGLSQRQTLRSEAEKESQGGMGRPEHEMVIWAGLG